jgi:hypothetical protein
MAIGGGVRLSGSLVILAVVGGLGLAWVRSRR